MELSLPNTIIVTGAGGWLGKRLVHLLVKRAKERCPSFKIRCLVQPDDPWDPTDPAIDMLKGDLADFVSCERLCKEAKGAIVIHAAGVIHPHRVRDFYRNNVRATENMLVAATRSKVKRFIAVSSNSPCGCNPSRTHLFDENSPYNPYMNYGRSKMLMEIAVRSAHGREGLETAIVRAPWFYGPDQPPRQSLFFKMIRSGKFPLLGDGNNRRSMVYVDNLCRGILLAATHPAAAGETFWIADERPYTMNEIISTVETLLEKEFNVKCAGCQFHMPSFVGDMAEAFDACLQSVGLYNQKIHVLSEMNKTIACSISKAQNLLGYHPGIALKEGMYQSLLWMKERGFSW